MCCFLSTSNSGQEILRANAIHISAIQPGGHNHSGVVSKHTLLQAVLMRWLIPGQHYASKWHNKIYESELETVFSN